MAETLVADAPTLRRIAFLVVRIAQDDESLRRPMAAIAKVIDQLKRSIALGVPFERSEVARLRSLVHRLERKQARRPAAGTIGRTIIAELDDLARNLCARTCGNAH